LPVFDFSLDFSEDLLLGSEDELPEVDEELGEDEPCEPCDPDFKLSLLDPEPPTASGCTP
jgi:hypothetical protein